MSIDQIYKQAIKMKVGDRKTFTLDDYPKRGAMAVLCEQLSEKSGDERHFSAIRNGLQVELHCYIPD